jgi:hypothetical protein
MRRNRLRVHMGELQSSQTGAGYSSESISRTGDTTHYSSRCSSTRVRLPCSSPNVFVLPGRLFARFLGGTFPILKLICNFRLVWLRMLARAV